MSGVVFAVGPCYWCGAVFTFNPLSVPSFHGEQPICRSCIDEVNQLRASRGMPTFTIHPDAYGAAEPGQL